MDTKQNKSIETAQIDRQSIDIDRLIINIDPVHSVQTILAVFALINGVKNLVKYTKKLLKQPKLDRTTIILMSPIVGAIAPIVKAVTQLCNENPIDRDDEAE